jgi:hypothetical protein
VAKGLYVMRDGQVLVDYGTRQVPISLAQYRANGYRPLCDRLPAEPPSKTRQELGRAEARKAHSAPPTYLRRDRNAPVGSANA